MPEDTVSRNAEKSDREARKQAALKQVEKRGS